MSVDRHNEFGSRRLWQAGALLIALALGVSVGAAQGFAEHSSEPSTASVDWILTPERAKKLVTSRDAKILDVRARAEWRAGHLPGAVVVEWQSFTPDQQSSRGRLLESDATLQRRIRALDVSDEQPVVVVGETDGGWGEAGRIVWMLRTLGHEHAGWVDGGHAAVVGAGAPEKSGAAVERGPAEADTGNFTVDRRGTWSISRDELREVYDDEGVVLLDTREAREYDGGTPYGESRGGHIPGARHLHFKELLDESGRLKSDATIRKLLAERGVESGTLVVTYCTGGVRSAWVASVLIELGYDEVRNYAGSTWEWASGDAEKYPLEW